MRQLCLMLVFIMMAACATAESNDDWKYIVSEDGTLQLRRYLGTSNDLIFPSVLDSRIVTSIGTGNLNNLFYRIGHYPASISIPDSVISIMPDALLIKLNGIYVSPDHPVFATIDGTLFNKQEKALLRYPANSIATSYTVPSGITALAAYSFSLCDSLTTIHIPDSVTSIGNNAFDHCSSLSSLTLPDSITHIGEGCFITCDALTSISLPPQLEQISKGTFFSCSSLTDITLPNQLVSIGDAAFYGCDSLRNLNIPETVNHIGTDAFMDCPQLILTVPRNSYAAQWAKENNVPYTYPDANDWLLN